MTTVREAKNIVRDWLATHQPDANVVSGKTVPSPFGGASRIFVAVGGWKASPDAAILAQLARKNGFSVEFRGFPSS